MTKSHTPFRLVPKSTTLDDSNGRYAHCYRKDASFGAHHKNLNEDKPILSAAKCRPMTLVSGGIRHMRIFAKIPWGGGVKRQCGCRQWQFSEISRAIFSDTLEMRPVLLYRVGQKNWTIFEC